MPKYEDLGFLKNKILKIGNEEEILKGKNQSANFTQIPDELNNIPKKELELDHDELIKDIADDFEEGLKFDEDEVFSDLKEPAANDDFLSSLPQNNVNEEKNVLDDIESLGLQEDSGKVSKEQEHGNNLDALLAGLTPEKPHEEEKDNSTDELNSLLGGLTSDDDILASTQKESKDEFADLLGDLDEPKNQIQ